MTRLSTIIPALDEQAAVAAAVASARDGSHEVIVVDGGSTDATVDEARRAGARVIVSPRGRALQMNRGAEAARGDMLLFLHADCVLGADAIAEAKRAVRCGAVGGWFRQRHDAAAFSYRVLEWGANLRAGLLRLPFGDQAIFVRADVFRELGGYPAVPMMEDVMFAQRLRGRGRFAACDATVTSSARRHRLDGPWRTQLRFWSFSIRFAAGVELKELAKEYTNVR